MRLFPVLAALLVVVVLFMLVFQRDTLNETAGLSDVETVTQDSDTEGDTGDTDSGVSVVAYKSVAREIDTPVILRGRTEAQRRVDVRAETTGQVISDKITKGTQVVVGDILCVLDPGTRSASLAEAKARLAEAQARAPEAEARVIEAQARLDEATINLTAAEKLAQGGFASDTRVANAKAAVQSARASTIAAQSGAASSDALIQSAEAGVAAATRELERLNIIAPFDGELETDTADTGTFLQPGAACATLVQYDPVRVVGNISELLVDQMSTGQAASIKLASGRALSGEVTFVADVADPITRTFRVDVEVQTEENAALVRAGQTAEVIVSGQGAPAHLLPQSALTLDDEGRLGVRIVDTGNIAGFTQVQMIRDTVEGVWVSGLGEATDVIIVGHHYVSDGVALDVTYAEPGL